MSNKFTGFDTQFSWFFSELSLVKWLITPSPTSFCSTLPLTPCFAPLVSRGQRAVLSSCFKVPILLKLILIRPLQSPTLLIILIQPPRQTMRDPVYCISIYY
jgi:hypothetical protein